MGLRLLGFGACLLGAAVCFFVAFLTLPMLALRPAKFALAFRCAAQVLPCRKSAHLRTVMQLGKLARDVRVRLLCLPSGLAISSAKICRCVDSPFSSGP